MEFLPRTMGTRPRVALELRPEGVIAARAGGGTGLLAAVSRGPLREGALRPGLRVGNVVDRAAVSGALRRVLDGVSPKGADRSKYVTVVVPDAAVRVLLLDFDALPGKAAEALAVVRFRLKKLLPFDAEHAVVSYQIMSSGRDAVRVLAVAMPCDVLAEYEGVVTEAGYLPGAVLPSTLAALAGLEVGEVGAAPALVVNAGPDAVTTAIVQGGGLLLHRTVDMRSEAGESQAGSGAGFAGERGAAQAQALGAEAGQESGAGRLAAGGRFLPMAAEGLVEDRMRREAGVEEPRDRRISGDSRDLRDRSDFDRMDAEAAMQSGVLRRQAGGALPSEADEAVQVLNETDPVSMGRDVTQAVSVAAAYFEDTLGGAPAVVLAAGTMGAERLGAVLKMYGMEGLRVREMVDAAAIGVGASGGAVPRGWLAGVRGALRS